MNKKYMQIAAFAFIIIIFIVGLLFNQTSDEKKVIANKNIAKEENQTTKENIVKEIIVSDTEIGLRKSTVENENDVEFFDINYGGADAGTSQKIDRSFENAPPLISHTIEDMLPITIDNNMCLSCHIKEIAADMGATPIPTSHYVNMRGLLEKGDKTELSEISNERFNCDQCHVPQTDAKPLVKNYFEAVFQNEADKSKSDLIESLNEGVIETKIQTYDGK